MTEHPYQFTLITMSDGEALIKTFNHYIEGPVSPAFFEKLLPSLKIYPSVAVRDDQNIQVGFGMLWPDNQMPAFRHTVEITCFIRPDLTGQGKGAGIRTSLPASPQGMRRVSGSIPGLGSLSADGSNMPAAGRAGSLVPSGCRRRSDLRYAPS